MIPSLVGVGNPLPRQADRRAGQRQADGKDLAEGLKTWRLRSRLNLRPFIASPVLSPFVTCTWLAFAQAPFLLECAKARKHRLILPRDRLGFRLAPSMDHVAVRARRVQLGIWRLAPPPMLREILLLL